MDWLTIGLCAFVLLAWMLGAAVILYSACRMAGLDDRRRGRDEYN